MEDGAPEEAFSAIAHWPVFDDLLMTLPDWQKGEQTQPVTDDEGEFCIRGATRLRRFKFKGVLNRLERAWRNFWYIDPQKQVMALYGQVCSLHKAELIAFNPRKRMQFFCKIILG